MTSADTESAHVAPEFANHTQQSLAAVFGTWVFLATEVLFFAPLFFGYLYVRTHFPDASAAASRHTDMLLGTINTALLLTSSLCMALAGALRRDGKSRAAAWLLTATAVLGLAFLVIKGWEYHTEFGEHLFPGAAFAPADAHDPARRGGMQMFFVLYFAMTGLHALHLALGIVACVTLAVGLARGARRFASTEHMEVVGLYWHFVDLVWIFLYPLLYLVGRSGG
jgi:cytochrome c oxidase subunit III